MWLLNSCTWEMKEFISNKQAPPYAILSHTWGDEEVSFRDWQYEPMKDIGEKAGFTKIKYCCQQAASDGLEWLWIDTCCIDKSSSAELSEAINSMFQWYSNAAVCYAYLCDMADDSEVDFAKSRWVTRGWTLQELIAPREVVFYSSSWQVLGTRSELSEHLSKITGIEEPFLLGRSLDKASIAQRMSWASKRTTSREEDMAYCLLGIFSVNMPLIYGEGIKAFRRLQETLVREYPYDHSLFAWGKVVEQHSNAIYDDEQISGTKPIKHEAEKVVDNLLGLLAESPKDFEHSGRIVIAPAAAKYFYYASKVPSVSSLIGRTAHVELPQFEIGPHLAFYVNYPPIVRIIYIRHIVILCGQWDYLHTNFHYVAIPVADTNDQTSRTDEIIVGRMFTQLDYARGKLTENMRKFTIVPQPLPSPRATDLVIRRHATVHSWTSRTHKDVDISFIDGIVKSTRTLKGTIFCYAYTPNTTHEFAVAAMRVDELNHSHEDPADGRKCGKLRFAVHPFIVSSDEVPEVAPLAIVDKQDGSKAPAAEELFKAQTFKTRHLGLVQCFQNWNNMKFSHDMAVPRDKWSISIGGIADIHVFVERFFLDEYDRDDDETNEDESHSFVDILDIVIAENS